MIRTAFSIFFHEYDLKNFFLTTAAGIFSALCFVLLYLLVWLAHGIEVGILSYAIAGLLVTGSIFSLAHYKYEKYSRLSFQSPLQSFLRNIKASHLAKKSLAFLDLETLKAHNFYRDIELEAHPNIYFIIVESYGRIMMDEPKLFSDYKLYMPQLEKSLVDSGWQISTNTTISPVTGGASWISYTSLLYGLKVKGQGVFLALMRNKRMHEYESMFRWLKNREYMTCRLSSLGGFEKMAIPYDDYSRMYGFDHWVTYRDLKYNGQHYGFGPSPPDQYSLHFCEEKIRNKFGNKPFALFFITQNSHTPYETPEMVVENWKELQNREFVTNEKNKFWSKPDFDQYAKAIRYQMHYLSDFILKKGTDQDIFILVGDHQPPSLTKKIENFETPMHIVSKNAEFVDHFRERGFVKGLKVTGNHQPIRQEAFFSAFMQSMNFSFGKDKAVSLPYLKNGIEY
jgi:hypothetical protein